MNEDAEIKAVLDARRAGLETKDAKASLQGFGPEPVLFDLAPPLAISGAASRLALKRMPRMDAKAIRSSRASAVASSGAASLNLRSPVPMPRRGTNVL
mgnify:CR=1 FL=1